MDFAEHTAFERAQSELASGQRSLDEIVTEHIGSDETRIKNFIRETSLYDLQDHFRAAGKAGTALLELSQTIELMRRNKITQRDISVHEMAIEIIQSFSPIPYGKIQMRRPGKPENNPAVNKFFDVLGQLKQQGAPVAAKLVETWIEKDIVDAQPTPADRNNIRARLMRSQFEA